jgi:ABC-type lipoprotein export system ATPase subunit
MALIRLEKITRVYDLGEVKVPVLHGVSLSIEPGEMVALMGASGSGKTTMMNIIGCLDRPTTGSYWLDDQEVGQLSLSDRAMLRNKLIGFVFQSFNLLPRTSAVEQVTMPLSYTASALDDKESISRAEKILHKVGLGDRMHHLPSQLSGGQQQRVAIARALVNRPPLILADEPTGNLDSRTSVEILEMFRELNQTEGITILLVTHDADVASFARRTIHIKDGNIESDTVNESLAAASAGSASANGGSAS